MLPVSVPTVRATSSQTPLFTNVVVAQASSAYDEPTYPAGCVRHKESEIEPFNSYDRANTEVLQDIKNSLKQDSEHTRSSRGCGQRASGVTKASPAIPLLIVQERSRELRANGAATAESGRVWGGQHFGGKEEKVVQ